MEEVFERFKHSQCDYCKNTIDTSSCDSEWCEQVHYKSLSCTNCGKKTWSQAKFDGSGHDCSTHEEFTPLESTVRKVSEG